jgi:hypothetical protein
MLLELVSIFLALGGYFYWKFCNDCNYWLRLGVKQPEENTFFIGNNPYTCYR